LAWLINNQYLQFPNANRLYVVFVEPGTEVSQGGWTSGHEKGIEHFLGYHGAFGNATQVFYAVIPYPGGINVNISSLPNPIDGITEVTSHEVAEAATDPNLRYGWRDYGIQGENEIGDLANLQYGFWNGWVVQKEAGRNDQPMAPAGFGPQFTLTNSGPVRDFDATTDAAGNPVVVGLGTDNQVWIESPGHPWTLTQSGTVKTARITRDAAGRLEIFVIGMDDQVWAEIADNGTWGNWMFTSSGDVKQLSATPDANGNPLIFAIGTDNQVWVESWTSGWTLANPGQVLAISAVTDGSGNVVLFAIGMDYQVYVGQLGTGWSLTQAGQVKAIAATVDANGRAEVFVAGNDSQVYFESANADGTWNPWTITRTGTVQDLCIVPNGTKRDIYCLGMDNQIWVEEEGVF
jgi:hypothetical protein